MVAPFACKGPRRALPGIALPGLRELQLFYGEIAGDLNAVLFWVTQEVPSESHRRADACGKQCRGERAVIACTFRTTGEVLGSDRHTRPGSANRQVLPELRNQMRRGRVRIPDAAAARDAYMCSQCSQAGG